MHALTFDLPAPTQINLRAPFLFHATRGQGQCTRESRRAAALWRLANPQQHSTTASSRSNYRRVSDDPYRRSRRPRARCRSTGRRRPRSRTRPSAARTRRPRTRPGCTAGVTRTRREQAPPQCREGQQTQTGDVRVSDASSRWGAWLSSRFPRLCDQRHQLRTATSYESNIPPSRH